MKTDEIINTLHELDKKILLCGAIGKKVMVHSYPLIMVGILEYETDGMYRVRVFGEDTRNGTWASFTVHIGKVGLERGLEGDSIALHIYQDWRAK